MVDVQSEYYVWPQYKELVASFLGLRECLTITGLFGVGKSRLLKKIAYEEKLEDVLCFFDTSRVGLARNVQDELARVRERFERLYSDGKRIFVIPYSFPDRVVTRHLFLEYSKFRQSCIEPISFVFFLDADPNVYEDIFVESRIVFNELIMMSLTANGYFDFIIKQNEIRYGATLTDNQKEMISRYSGGIPVLVKEYVKNITRNPDDNFSDCDVSHLTRYCLDLIPDRLLTGLKGISSGRTVDPLVRKYLLDAGIINSEDQIVAKAIEDALHSYSRDYQLEILGKKILVNSNDVSKAFSARERLLLKELKENAFISREDVGKICAGKNGESDVSEYSVDKAISRLRRKLFNLGVRKDFIQTKKKKGYYCNDTTTS